MEEESHNGEFVSWRKLQDTYWKWGIYAETSVFKKGLTRVDKRGRPGGRVLNFHNPSAMSPTTKYFGATIKLTITLQNPHS